jgi:hypothetical protein
LSIDRHDPLSDCALAVSGKASTTINAKSAERWVFLENVVRRGGTNSLQHESDIQLRFA